MKTLLLFLSLLCSGVTMAQYGDQYHSWNFSYGRTGTPGDQIKAGLEYASTDKLSFYGEPSIEWSKYQGLQYSSIGLMLGARYYLYGGNDMANTSKINILAGLNALAQYENEKNVLKNLPFSQKLNYGAAGQVLAEYFYDPTIGIFLGYEQKYLLKEVLGKYNYSFFIGLRIHFGNN